MKKIMILGASILQLPAIKKAKEMGLDVIAVDMDPDAVGFKEEGITKLQISTIDTPPNCRGCSCLSNRWDNDACFRYAYASGCYGV